jgi:hypothetical protein
MRAHIEPPLIAALKTCIACGCVSEKMDKCMLCHKRYGLSSYFCSRQCQKNDWAQHKLFHAQNEESQRSANPQRPDRAAETTRNQADGQVSDDDLIGSDGQEQNRHSSGDKSEINPSASPVQRQI